MSLIAGFSCIFVLIVFPLAILYARFFGNETEQKQPLQFFNFKIYSNYLPIYLIMVFIIEGFLQGKSDLIRTYIPTFLSIVITIGLYNAIMLSLLSFMRGYFSSTLISALWVVPNILYVFIYLRNGLNPPLLVIHLSPVIYWGIIFVWMAGFISVFLIRIFSHLKFRHEILKTAIPEVDPEILELWEKTKNRTSRLPRKLPLYRSCTIQSPLSIGIWSIFVVLPQKEYTEDELNWIFLHELTHICNRDCSTKLFLTFCNALFWFFPPSWKLISKVSEDLEYSCDEIVLLQNPNGSRKEYASLILDSNACDKGFTTCLSSSGSCMAYRLKQIMHPVKANIVGETIVIMIASILLLFTCGRVQVSSEADMLSKLIFSEERSTIQMPPTSSYSDVEDMSLIYDGSLSELWNYLDSTEGYAIAGTRRFTGVEKCVDLISENWNYTLEFSDHQLYVRKFDSEGLGTDYYYYLKTNNWKELT